ncbi:hypothetical protein [Gracilibacillus dipsosauri]|uniref:DUF4352 domain-containing protein n=1 Tax=Gracilibacillus dipsosauri TaxID=178340 RepID=A0A317L0X6_9BACI|nr:hypothetical protein [Gracilibacillus dipsosauri]PWU69432.1 hypothetical protein DLJ74_05505 [Gracilibacillus dipsosauri]
MKKVIVFLLASFIILTGCSSTSENDREQRIINSEVSIGTVESEHKQKLTYEITIANEDDVSVVDTVNVIPSMNIKDRLIETKKQDIKYNKDTIEINGEIIFDSKGLSKEEITTFEPYIKGLQFVGDNNKEYLLVNNSSE